MFTLKSCPVETQSTVGLLTVYKRWTQPPSQRVSQGNISNGQQGAMFFPAKESQTVKKKRKRKEYV